MSDVQLLLICVAGLALGILVVATLRMMRPESPSEDPRARRPARPLEDDPIIAALGLGRGAGGERRNRR